MNLKFWKHKEKKEVISQACYNKLPETHQSNYIPSHEEPTHKVEQNDDGDFTTSMIMGMVTGNGFLGGAIGGDLLGGIVGSELSGGFDSSSSSDFGGFDGGSFGGGGASGDF